MLLQYNHNYEFIILTKLGKSVDILPIGYNYNVLYNNINWSSLCITYSSRSAWRKAVANKKLHRTHIIIMDISKMSWLVIIAQENFLILLEISLWSSILFCRHFKWVRVGIVRSEFLLYNSIMVNYLSFVIIIHLLLLFHYIIITIITTFSVPKILLPLHSKLNTAFKLPISLPKM